VAIFTTGNADTAREYQPILSGRHTYRIAVPGNLLAPDNYYVRVAGHQPHMQSYDAVDTVSFRIEDVGSLRSVFHDDRAGIIEPVLNWTDTHEK
jgi:hypothetical protein